MTGRRLIALVSLLVALALASPAGAAPEGQVTWGVHITLAPTWFDPADMPSLITPFMMMYAMHEGMAKAMGAKCKLPVKKLGSRPGSLGSFIGVTLGKPIITMELPENAGMDGEKLWKEYGEALIAALRYQPEKASEGKSP